MFWWIGSTLANKACRYSRCGGCKSLDPVPRSLGEFFGVFLNFASLSNTSLAISPPNPPEPHPPTQTTPTQTTPTHPNHTHPPKPHPPKPHPPTLNHTHPDSVDHFVSGRDGVARSVGAVRNVVTAHHGRQAISRWSCGPRCSLKPQTATHSHSQPLTATLATLLNQPH